MLTFTVEELIRFLSNWTMTFFEGAKRSGDIVFSRYYSFFKRPVLVREHQVESLYVMVQNRDSSDKKKPSFSRFAKWEFGGFIVDSKTIYLASKPVSVASKQRFHRRYGCLRETGQYPYSAVPKEHSGRPRDVSG